MVNILAVDDQSSVRQLVKHVLESQGHHVTLAVDSQEAIGMAREHSFDLVISDVNMPSISGISLVSKLRKQQHLQGAPILMLTTDSSDYKKQKARTSGASGWLQKPFDDTRLSSAISKFLH